MKHFPLGVAVLTAILCGCDKKPTGAPPSTSKPAPIAAPAVTLQIAAAASVRPLLEELGAAFEATHPAGKSLVEITPGASGTLFAQISNGAPFDVFFAADMKYPERVVTDGFASGAARPYAVGRLALLRLRREGAIGLGPNAIKEENVKRIAIANPETAPYGRAAQQAMKAMGVEARDRLAVAENADQALQFALSGNADLAFVPLSLALQPAVVEKGEFWMVPEQMHEPIVHGAVVLKGSGHPELAKEFFEFVLGRGGRAAIEAAGFGVPPTDGKAE